jgi:hypothetical protein
MKWQVLQVLTLWDGEIMAHWDGETFAKQLSRWFEELKDPS